jgi:hypothetical protein
MKNLLLVFTLLSAPFFTVLATADQVSDHSVVHAQDLNWMKGPEGLAPGSEFAVLEGNPEKAELFTIRLKWPAGYMIAPHFHSQMEQLTVLQGTFYIKMGAVAQNATEMALGTHDFIRLNPSAPHSAYVKEETILQITGMGPFDITYVNADDDPRQ